MRTVNTTAFATRLTRLALRPEPIVLVVMTALVFGYLLHALPRIPNDYDEHSAFAQHLAEGTLPPMVHAHLLFPLATIGVQRLTLGQMSYETAGSIAGLLSYIATALLLYRLYEVGFQFWDTGYAAAMTIVLVVVLASVALFQFFVLDKRVHYK